MSEIRQSPFSVPQSALDRNKAQNSQAPQTTVPTSTPSEPVPLIQLMKGVVNVLGSVIKPSQTQPETMQDALFNQFDMDQLLPEDDSRLSHIHRLLDQIDPNANGIQNTHLQTMATMEMQLLGFDDARINRILALKSAGETHEFQG